jgi:hypothetical protein
MPATDRVMSGTAEMPKEASDTHELVNRHAEEGQCVEQSTEMAREGSETHALVTKNTDRGEGDEQSRRDGKGSV